MSELPRSSNKDISVRVLSKSLRSGRVGHAYLFSSGSLEQIESIAIDFAQRLLCENPLSGPMPSEPGNPCGQCRNCRNVANRTHVDVHWVRPESKSRVILLDQMRDLMGEIYLKPTESNCKVAIVVAADRLNPVSANAFLKTLEEPPPRSVLLLLTTEPSRVLETIRSRCLRLTFDDCADLLASADAIETVRTFAELIERGRRRLMDRYGLLSLLLGRLASIKRDTEAALLERSPLSRYEEPDPRVRAQWEDDLEASVEAEYRRQRAQLLLAIQWWFRDVWLATVKTPDLGLALPSLSSTTFAVASRVTPEEALANVEVLEKAQRQLASNVQELLVLEVALLHLRA